MHTYINNCLLMPFLVLLLGFLDHVSKDVLKSPIITVFKSMCSCVSCRLLLPKTQLLCMSRLAPDQTPMCDLAPTKGFTRQASCKKEAISAHYLVYCHILWGELLSSTQLFRPHPSSFLPLPHICTDPPAPPWCSIWLMLLDSHLGSS